MARDKCFIEYYQPSYVQMAEEPRGINIPLSYINIWYYIFTSESNVKTEYQPAWCQLILSETEGAIL